MDPDRNAAADAMHSAVVALLEAAIPEKRTSRRS
jgi:hypothetical protein